MPENSGKGLDILKAEAQGIPGILVRKTDPRANYGFADLSEVPKVGSQRTFRLNRKQQV